jgi:hypothetical protein
MLVMLLICGKCLNMLNCLIKIFHSGTLAMLGQYVICFMDLQ